MSDFDRPSRMDVDVSVSFYYLIYQVQKLYSEMPERNKWWKNMKKTNSCLQTTNTWLKVFLVIPFRPRDSGGLHGVFFMVDDFIGSIENSQDLWRVFLPIDFNRKSFCSATSDSFHCLQPMSLWLNHPLQRICSAWSNWVHLTLWI